MQELWPLITSYAIRIVGVVALFVFAWIVAGRIRILVSRSLEKAGFDTTLAAFLANASRWLIIILALLGCLGAFGIETTSFAALLGAAGLAIGLAFQGSLSNVAAGAMLLMFRPFKVGDVIIVSGHTGKVSELGLFSTAIDTPDNRRMILPNAGVFGAPIENVTFHDVRRVDVSVGCDYGADLNATRTALEGAIAAVKEKVADPASTVVLMGLGDSSVNWQVRVWCNTADYFAVLEDATGAVKDSLDAAGSGIPYPTMDINLSK